MAKKKEGEQKVEVLVDNLSSRLLKKGQVVVVSDVPELVPQLEEMERRGFIKIIEERSDD